MSLNSRNNLIFKNWSGKARLRQNGGLENRDGAFQEIGHRVAGEFEKLGSEPLRALIFKTVAAVHKRYSSIRAIDGDMVVTIDIQHL